MNIKNFIKKHDIIVILIQLTAFGVLFAVSRLFFDDVYLFEWTARHRYLYVWGIAGVFTFFGKRIIGIAVTVGAVLGVPFGEVIGGVIRDIRMRGISEEMAVSEPGIYYSRSEHLGWFVWICGILAAVVVGVLVTAGKKRIKK